MSDLIHGRPADDSTRRFSDRVADYVRYRPGYPPTLIEGLATLTGMMPGWKVADVGAGTGISTDLLLRAGCEVWAVEPNEAMRQAAEMRFHTQPAFHSVNGTAEATTLPAVSVRLVVAGQAFHWFDPRATRAEFRRILGAAGWTALFWNDRSNTSTFMQAYEALLKEFGTDYARVRHENVDPVRLAAFFGGAVDPLIFDNEQVLDFNGLRGRLLSSSYVPTASETQAEPMLRALRALFDEHEAGGVVHFTYKTRLYAGRLS